MNAFNTPVSACKYCKFYNPIGRRGGSCQMLGVSVQGGWKGCQLGTPLFTAECEENCNLTHKNSRKDGWELSELQVKNLSCR